MVKIALLLLLIVIAIYGVFVVGGVALLSVIGSALQDISFRWYWGTVWSILWLPSIIVWVIAYILGLKILFKEVKKRGEEKVPKIENGIEGEDTSEASPQEDNSAREG